MDIEVLKFGGSSVSNNENLDIVANKIISFKDSGKSVVVVVSAQGKTTDKLIEEAKSLCDNPSKREFDMLLSIGEQISASKLAIVLNNKNYKAISLNAWQAGIISNGNFGKAKILDIDNKRILKELENENIVIITGFQGVDKDKNINTLGRGGSDTTAIAIAHSLGLKRCFIFSDVAGIYSSDPKVIENCKKLENISYNEMESASFEGAKVLHDRCILLAHKYNIEIISASTFEDSIGTKVTEENNGDVKTIVKNDKLYKIEINNKDFYKMLKEINKKKIDFRDFEIDQDKFSFIVLKDSLNEIKEICNHIKISNISRVSIIGQGINYNKRILNIFTEWLKDLQDKVYHIEISEMKISILFKEKIDNEYLVTLHNHIFI